jgi:microcystin-dependent protein
MTGFLTLNAAPTQNLHAATKKYVDDNAYQTKYRYNIGTATSTISPSTPPEANARVLDFVSTLNLDVYRNGVLLVGDGVDYAVNVSTKTITFTTQLGVGAVVQINVGGVGSILANPGVEQIQAGTGVSINPAGGTGTVTVGINPSYDRFVPAGAIMAFGMNSAPSGWLICNGEIIGSTGTVQGVAASLLQTLRGLLGASHGTTGQLPDLRGIFVRGSGGPQTVGGISYSGTFSVKTADAFRSHGHSISDPGHTHGVAGYAGASAGFQRINSGTICCGVGPNTGASATGISINANGGSETQPANIALLYCIKY